ncbi:MAG: toprim domain-containing protein, partial [Candidatus Nanohalobium sp.]
MTIFDEISQALSFQDVAKKAEDRENKYYCGIHGDQDTPDLQVYEDGNWKCHSCGASGGDLVSYKAQLEEVSQGKAAKRLIQEHGLDIEFGDLSEEEKKRRNKLRRVRNCQEDVVEKARKNLSTAKRENLKDWRNWSSETIRDLKIGWMDEGLFNDLQERWGDLLEKAGIHYGMTGNKEGTYMIPHLKKNGQPYLVTCRDPEPDKEHEKYQQSKSTDFVENDIFYATGRDSETLVITEGYPDAISAYEEGFDAVAAGCGSFEGNKGRIASFSEKNYSSVFVVSDNDETGIENLQEIAQYLTEKTDLSVKIHQWKEDKTEGYDLDDWTSDNPGELEGLVEDAESYLDVFKNYNPSSIDAGLVKTRITARGNIKGQKQGDALPLEVKAWCKDCGASGYGLNLKSDLTTFITSRKNQHNLIQSKLSDKTCSECGGTTWGFKTTEYVDKSWIQLQDLIEDSEEFSITQNNKIPVYIVDDKLPSSKTVKVRGTVHVNSQNDEIFILADEIEPEEESFSQIELTPEDHQEYREKWSKEEAEKMVATDMVGRPKARTALQLTAHSPTRIPTITGEVVRGSLRTGFFGDGGTYKSKQVKDLTKDHYRLGGFVNAENSGRTGLTYTIDNDKKVIEWGALVLNDKGLVGIDGLNELHGDELTQIREVLEDQQVEVNRSVQGSAPARTRVIGCWNPPKQLFNYSNPAEALQEMEMFSGPDYRRWDLLVPFKDDDVSKQDIHYRDDGEKPYSEDFYKKHVKWAWNLTPEDIKFGNQFESELKTQSYNIANSYEFSNLPIVSGAFREKLTRLVVSWAVLKHSVTEDGKVKVTAEHVKETKEFFEDLMKDLGIDDAVADFQEKNTLDEEEFEELLDKYDDDQVELLEVVHDNHPISSSEIGAELDLSDRSVKEKWSDLKSDDLLRVKSGKGATTTPRTIQFIELLHEVHGFTNGSSKGEGGNSSESDENSEDSREKDSTHPPTGKQTIRENVKNVNQKVDKDYLVDLLKANDGKLYFSELEEMKVLEEAVEVCHEHEEFEEAFGTREETSELENAIVLKEEVKA